MPATDSHARHLVCKFGGTSLADADQIRKVEAIVRSDPSRRYIVVSAPGKRFSGDTKITDLLYKAHHLASQGRDITTECNELRGRFIAISNLLGLPSGTVKGWLDEVESGLRSGQTTDWVASRGEYLNARIIAQYLGATFVEAADCIRFTTEGRLSPTTYELMRSCLESDKSDSESDNQSQNSGADGLFVIPGFYGSDSEGAIKTFSRGGSDVTGAIVARAVHAIAYENWTDVDGLRMTDPRLVPNARPIREVTYQELRELAYMGASVLHDEAIFPVREAGIPIHIRNTNAPELPGTWIRPARPNTEDPIVGIAGRKGFAIIQVDKSMMNQELGFGRRMLQVLEEHGISYEHSPSSVDTMSVIIAEEALAPKIQSVLAGMEEALHPDRIEVVHNLALLATVGQGMRYRVGVASRVMGALAGANVNIRLIDQGASEINIIVGVDSNDFEIALRAIYNAFDE